MRAWKKNVAFLAGAVALSTLAAWYRWPDSAHAIGVIRKGGGTARHPVRLAGGRDAYALILTATVLPPYRGDARIAVEGDPPLDAAVELSRPIVDLGLRRWPSLDGDTLRGLLPGDRVALWLKLRPPRADPVCGMACGRDASRERRGDEEECFCSEACRDAFRANPSRFPARPVARGRWAVLLRDAVSGAPVLTVPVVLGGEEGTHAAHH